MNLEIMNRPIGRSEKCYLLGPHHVKRVSNCGESTGQYRFVSGYKTRSQNSSSEFQVRAGAPGMRSASGSGRREQAFLNSVQAFPCGLGQCRVCPDQIADHLPCGEVQGALGRGPHRQRNRALRAETDALRRRLLAGSDPYGLREQKNCHRFLTGLKLTTTAKAIQVVQTSSPGCPQRSVSATLSKALPVAQVCRRIPAGDGQNIGDRNNDQILSSEAGPDEPRFALARSRSHRAL